MMTSRRALLTDRSSFQPVLHDWCNQRERERNGLFNDALNTFYLRLYGVRHMVKDHSDSEKWCNQGRGMCYPACGMEHIKEPLLLIEKSSQWVVGSIVHGGPIELFLVPVLHDWCNQGRGMCYQNGP